MTNIGIIGAGNVGRGLAATLAGAGHDVLLTNSNPSGEALAAIAATTGATAVPLERALDTQVVVLAVPYEAALEIVAAHADALGQRLVIDATNPLTADYTGLTVAGHSSGAEQLAASAPDARFVKALNTIFAATYSNEALMAAGLVVPLASDDAAAAADVSELLASVGFDPLHVGGLVTSRFIEPMVMPLIHLGMFQGLGAEIGFALVRP